LVGATWKSSLLQAAMLSGKSRWEKSAGLTLRNS
jgi:hypothetical protein